MSDWSDYKFTMIVKDAGTGVERNVNSDNILFLAELGESGLQSGMYSEATIYSNEGVSHE